MPLPRPTPDESESDFIDRCMADSEMVDEYPDEERRMNACYYQWVEQGESVGRPQSPFKAWLRSWQQILAGLGDDNNDE